MINLSLPSTTPCRNGRDHTPPPPSGEANWDRPPQPSLAAEYRRMARRFDNRAGRLKALLTHETSGGFERLYDRGKAVCVVMDELQELAQAMLTIERG
jgi:hypothetical protein